MTSFGRWSVLGSSTRGASHRASGAPNQDAYAWRGIGDRAHPAVVAAIADGHGHQRHFRAERGARIAVDQACQRAADLEVQSKDLDGADLGSFGRETLVPSILGAWREAVADDYRENTFTPREEEIRAAANDDPVIAYGATLIVTVLGQRWVLVAQIGDGDVVSIRADGSVEAPVPRDPLLDGRRTTSLCQTTALGSFRIAVIDRRDPRLLALLVATDGFANAQVAEPWEPAVGADVATMLLSHGPRWVGRRLPRWTARCASSEGSGDDTTVVLAIGGP